MKAKRRRTNRRLEPSFNTVLLGIKVSTRLRDRMNRIAKKMGMTKSQLIRAVLNNFADEYYKK